MKKSILKMCCILMLVFTGISGCKKDKDTTVSGCNGITSVTDADGNTYPVVEIGSQCWMKENLRVSAGIPQVSDNSQWANIYNNQTQTSAWCYFQNDPNNGTIYGKIYNWYAVANVNLCPNGWHIPTDSEWKILEMYLGMSQADADLKGDRGTDEGGKMKATTLWSSPNTGATNSSGFTALPGGYRDYDGDFVSTGYNGVFWSSTEDSADLAWDRTLHFSNSVVNRYNDQKEYGFSCRCLKD